MHVTVIIMLILAILLVIFTLQNSFEVSISVFFWEIHNAPMVLVLLISFILGFIVAGFYFYPRLWVLEKKYRHSVQQGKKPENQEWSRQAERDPEGIELEPFDDEDDDD